MYISSLIIQNYKSIKDMVLEFSKGKNIIVGQNNAGKSNIISAINLLIGEKYPNKFFENNYYHNESNEFFVMLEFSECNMFDKSYL